MVLCERRESIRLALDGRSFHGGLSCLLLSVLPSSFGYADLQPGSTAE